MVGLSRLDSNKYARILAHKSSTLSPFNSISRPVSRVNEFGETEIGQIKHPYKTLSDAEIVKIAEAYRLGKTTYELAEQYSCCRANIVNALKKSGITASKAKAQEVINAKEVIKLYGEFHTTQEIADRFKVGPNAIIRCLRANGVSIRSRWDYPKSK